MESSYNEKEASGDSLWSYVDENVSVFIRNDSNLDNIIKMLEQVRRDYKKRIKENPPVVEPSQEEVLKLLKETFNYDPLTGLFTRIKDSKMGKIGMIANPAKKDYYIKIRLGKKVYTGGRLAFLFMTGKWPDGVVDHKDLDKTNNKWVNLRDVSTTTNTRNMPLRKSNKSGVTGVSWDDVNQKWHTSIYMDGKLLLLGRFADFDEAVSVRKAAESEHWDPQDRIWDKL